MGAQACIPSARPGRPRGWGCSACLLEYTHVLVWRRAAGLQLGLSLFPQAHMHAHAVRGHSASTSALACLLDSELSMCACLRGMGHSASTSAPACPREHTPMPVWHGAAQPLPQPQPQPQPLEHICLCSTGRLNLCPGFSPHTGNTCVFVQHETSQLQHSTTCVLSCHQHAHCHRRFLP